MITVEARVGENIDQLLRRFNREVLKSGILREIRDREFHVTNSEKKVLRKKEKARKVKLAQRYQYQR